MKAEKCSAVLRYALAAASTLCMLFFVYYSFRYSMRMKDLAFETIIYVTKDSLLLHGLTLLGFLAVTFGLCSFVEGSRHKERWIKGILYTVMSLLTIAGLIWVLTGNFFAQNDSRKVLECMERMRAGDFSDLLPEGYLGAYHQHFGLITLINFLYFVTHTTKDIVVQAANVLCLPVIVFAGWGIVKEIMDKAACQIFYCVLMLFCFPLLLYTPYVYGEIFSITAAMLFFYEGIRLLKGKEKRKLAGWIKLAVLAVIGNMARGNFPIVLIAFFIVALFYSISQKQPKLLVGALCLFLIVAGCSRLNLFYYERISGIRINQGVPVSSWLAQGLDENSIACGVYNGRDIETYARADYNREAAEEEARHFIADRLTMLKNGTGKGAGAFLKEKLLVQWNDPTLNCFMENRTFIPDPDLKWIKEVMLEEGSYFETTVELMNQYQWVVYLGCLLYCLFLFRKEKAEFYQLLLLITIFGGVLFSAIWEAMSRYVLPYEIYMIPLAAIGFGKGRELFQSVCARCQVFLHNRLEKTSA